MLAAAVSFLVIATLVWMSGEDMLIGLMLLVVIGGWSLLAVYGIASFVRAARSRSSRWLQQWAVAWLGCTTAFLGSFGLGIAGAPEGVRISLSRDSLIDAGERVLAGEHLTTRDSTGSARRASSGIAPFLRQALSRLSRSVLRTAPRAGDPGTKTSAARFTSTAYD